MTTRRPGWLSAGLATWRWPDPAEASVAARLLVTLAVLVPLWLGVAWAARG